MGCSGYETLDANKGVFYNEAMSKYIEISKKNICKIIVNEKEYGSGFF